jgi:hypothetical protein
MAFFIVATVPGQSTSMAFASFTDPVVLRGDSHIVDPLPGLRCCWALASHSYV